MLENPTAASIVAAVLSILLAFLGLDAISAERVRNRIIERDSIQQLCRAYYEGRPTGDGYYSFVPELALRAKVRLRGRRLCSRAEIARGLPPDRYKEGCEAARSWIATVGAFAKSVGVDERVALRRFLRTHHLGVVREGMIAMPFVLAMWAADELDAEQRREAAWGLALVEVAALYNAIARPQRQAIYFFTSSGPFGPVLRRPSLFRLPLLATKDRLYRSIRLRRWRWKYADRRMRRWARRLG